MSKWIEKKFGNIVTKQLKSNIKVSSADNSEEYPFFTNGEDVLTHSKNLTKGDRIYLSTGGVAGVKFYSGHAAYSTDTLCLSTISDNAKFVYYCLLNNLALINNTMFIGSGLKHLQKKDLNEKALLLPIEIDEQRKIAEVLSTVDETIEKTTALIEKYTAIKRGLTQNLLEADNEFLFSSLGKAISGGTPSTTNPTYWENENVWITPADLSNLTTPFINKSTRMISKSGVIKATGVLLPANSIIISNRAPVGYCAIPTVPFSFNQGCKGLICNENVDPLYLYYYLTMSTSELERVSSGTTFLELPTKELKRFRVKMPANDNGKPDIEKQKKLSSKIYAADKKIETERNYLNKLQNIKKGLMQDLLTNKVSVVQLLKEEAI